MEDKETGTLKLDNHFEEFYHKMEQEKQIRTGRLWHEGRVDSFLGSEIYADVDHRANERL